MTTCNYCNAPSSYQFKNGVHCCSKNVSGCPEIRNRKKLKCIEKYGDENFRNTEKSRNTKKEKYGAPTFNNRTKAKETLLKIYGVDNISKHHEIKDKKQDSFNKNYPVDSVQYASLISTKQNTWRKKDKNELDNIRNKKKETVIQNGGRWVPDNLLPEFYKYKKQVIYITNRNDLSLLENFEKRSKRGYHLDHRYSIIEGFLNNVSPDIVGHIKNLEMIPANKNISKREKCSITLEELIREINSGI